MPTSPRQYRFRTGCPKGRDIENGREAEAASPTIRFRKRHTKGRADNIRPTALNMVGQQTRKGSAKNSQKPVEVGSEGKESAERKTV